MIAPWLRLEQRTLSEPACRRDPDKTHRFSFEWNAGDLDQPVEHTKPVVVRIPLVANKTVGRDDTNRRLRHYASAQFLGQLLAHTDRMRPRHSPNRHLHDNSYLFAVV